jgi:hypothetical protein
MQSGLAGTDKWLLEYETISRRKPEPLMGWSSSGDTLNQVSLKFDSQEDAVNFAVNNGWEYSISNEHKRKIKPRNYTDNFKYVPAEE